MNHHVAPAAAVETDSLRVRAERFTTRYGRQDRQVAQALARLRAGGTG